MKTGAKRILAAVLSVSLAFGMNGVCLETVSADTGGYQQLGQDAKVYGDFTFTSAINTKSTGVFADTEGEYAGQAVAGSKRPLAANESAVVKFADGFRYYDGNMYDVYIKVTADDNLTGNTWDCSPEAGGKYYTLSPTKASGTGFYYEIWLQQQDVRATDVDMVAGSCYTAAVEAARPFGDNGYIYTQIPQSDLKWDETYQSWSPVSGSYDKNTIYILGHGKTAEGSIKGGYVRKSGNGGCEIVLGYLIQQVQFKNEAGAPAGDLSYTVQKAAEGKVVIPPEVSPQDGYYLAYWTASEDVTLTDGTVIAMGEPVSPVQLTQTMADKAFTATAHYEACTYSADGNEFTLTQDGSEDTTLKVLLTAENTTYSGSAYDETANIALEGLQAFHLSEGKNVSVVYYTAEDDTPVTMTTQENSGAASEGAAPVNPGTYYAAATLYGKMIYTKFTIYKPSIENVSASGYRGVYDKAPHTIQVTAPDTATVTYSETEDGIYAEEAPVFTDVTDGVKTVYYKVSQTGYETFTGCADVEITKADADAPQVAGIAETVDGRADGQISGLTENMQYRVKGQEDWIDVTGNDSTFAAGTYEVRYAENKNYKASDITQVTVKAGAQLPVVLPENQQGYTLTADRQAVGWNGSVTLTFTLKEGYTKTTHFIVKVNEKTVEFNEDGTLTLDTIEEIQNVSVEGVEDVTAPEGTIKVASNSFKTFVNKVTFGLFFKETQTVTIETQDLGSGVAKTAYYVSDKALSKEEVMQLSDEDWKDGSKVDIEPDGTYIIYAKVTDYAGNAAYISSEGIVVYTDAAQDTKVFDYVKVSGEDKQVRVKTNGNTISQIKLGDTVLNKNVDYIAEEDVITFKAAYLQQLAASETPYEFKISYCPLGIEFMEGAENDVPDETTVALTVSRAQLPEAAVSVTSTRSEYDGKAHELAAAKTENGILVYRLGEDGTWTESVPSAAEAGTYRVYYYVKGDDNYKDAGSEDSPKGYVDSVIELQPQKTEGVFSKDTEISEDAPIQKASLNTSETDLKNKGTIFTDEERKQIEEGLDVKVWLEIKKTDFDKIKAEDIRKVEEAAVKYAGENPTILYFDAEMYKAYSNAEKTPIYEPGEDINISVTIPDELMNHDKSIMREYKIIRLHTDRKTGNGIVDILSGSFDAATQEFTFATNQFSTYALVYNDSPVEQPTQPVTEPSVEPTTKSEPTTEAPSTKPSVEPTVEPTTKSEPTTETPATEPSTEPTVEPTTKSEPTTEVPVTKPSVEPTTEAPVTKPSAGTEKTAVAAETTAGSRISDTQRMTDNGSSVADTAQTVDEAAAVAQTGQTASTSEKQDSANSVKTGDSAQIWLWAALLFASAGMTGAACKKSTRKKKTIR